MDIIHNSKRLLFEEKEDFWMKKNKILFTELFI
jgi:hypothetical protein